MGGKHGFDFEAGDGFDEEPDRKIVRGMAMRRLTVVPSDSIDFDEDYRSSLGAIAEGRFLTEADMAKRRRETLAYDFGEEADPVSGVWSDIPVNKIDLAENSEGLIATIRKALRRTFGGA